MSDILPDSILQGITVVSGFNRLITCNGSLYVNNNDHLGSISGFNGLVTVNGDMRIAGSYNQEGHPSVTGFNQLEEVSGILYLGRIRSLVGFGALARAGSFIVENNRRILAFPAFNALQTVPGNFYIQDSDNVRAAPSRRPMHSLRDAACGWTRLRLPAVFVPACMPASLTADADPRPPPTSIPPPLPVNPCQHPPTHARACSVQRRRCRRSTVLTPW